jgi:hypothetical protein
MARAGKLTADLELRSASFQRDMRNAARSVETNTSAMRQSLGGIERGFGIAAKAAAAFVGVLAVREVVQFAKSSFDAADQVAKMADRMGVTTTAFQELAFAAKLGGVEATEFEQAMAFLNRRIAEGQTRYTNVEQALAGIAEEMRGTTDDAKRVGIALENFGSRAGARMVPVLQQGAGALAELRRQAQDMGVVFDESLVRGAEAAKDQMEILAFVVERNLQKALIELAPVIADAARGLAELAAGIAKWVAGPSRADQLLAQMQAIRAEAKRLSEINEALAREPWPSPENFAAIDRNMELIAQLYIELRGLEAQYAALGKAGTGAAKALSGEFQLTAEQVKELTRVTNEAWATFERRVATSTRIFADTRSEGEKLNLEIDELRRLADEGTISWDLYGRAVSKAQSEFLAYNEAAVKSGEATAKTDDAARELGLTFTSAFEDAVVAGNSLRDVVRGIAQDLLRLAIRQTITEPLFGLFKGLLSPGSGLGGFDVGPALGTGATWGAFAAGTPSAPAGWAMVGEEGPELVKFRGGETVLPHGVGPAGGGTYYIDARGADRAGMARLEAMIAALNGSIEQRSVAAVVGARNRNPGLLR